MTESGSWNLALALPERSNECGLQLPVPPSDNSHVEIPKCLEVDRGALTALCDEFGVLRLAAFGSVLRDEFAPDSGIDLLVEFDPSRTPELLRVSELELQMSHLFGGREIEVWTYEDLSRYFRDEFRDQAIALYEAV